MLCHSVASVNQISDRTFGRSINQGEKPVSKETNRFETNTSSEIAQNVLSVRI